MRRSTAKAAAAIVALSVAIPALAETSSSYVIGPDGSVEYAEPSALSKTPVQFDEPVNMETLIDASSAPTPTYVETYAPAPVYTQTYTAPAPAPVEYVNPAPAAMTYGEAFTAPAPMPAPVQPVTTYVEPVQTYTEPVITYVEPDHTMPLPVSSGPDYTTLTDPVQIQTLSALPVNAPSGLSIASRGDGSYGQTTIDRGGESPAGQSTDIFISKSAIINLPADATEVSVSDPRSVRAVLRTARQIVLIGLQVGSTNIIAFDDDNNQILSLDVNVRYDLRPLRNALKRDFPDTLVDVDTLLGEVILTGAAADPSQAAEIRQLVRRYLYSAMLGAGIETDADSIQFVDRLATSSDDQVLLKVRVAEMRRSVIKQFGVDWSLATSTAAAAATGGAPFLGGDFIRSLSGLAPAGGLSANLAGSIGNTDFGALVKAFERHNVMRTLAEPTLTAVSGETASFLAGGQFPYPVSVEDGEVGYDFRDFGVALEFTPVVVGPGRISLRIATEVSELTNEGALTTALLTIPGISVRRANTTVELPSGGTMSIAGMLLQRDRASHAGLPGLKNVPVVGQLFSSSDYLKEETELVILVTPYVVKPGQEKDFRLPTDGFAPASDIDFYLLGRLHKIYGTGDQDIAAARQALNAPLGFIIE